MNPLLVLILLPVIALLTLACRQPTAVRIPVRFDPNTRARRIPVNRR